jgi:hypothetical protein
MTSQQLISVLNNMPLNTNLMVDKNNTYYDLKIDDIQYIHRSKINNEKLVNELNEIYPNFEYIGTLKVR